MGDISPVSTLHLCTKVIVPTVVHYRLCTAGVELSSFLTFGDDLCNTILLLLSDFLSDARTTLTSFFTNFFCCILFFFMLLVRFVISKPHSRTWADLTQASPTLSRMAGSIVSFLSSNSSSTPPRGPVFGPPGSGPDTDSKV